MTSLFLSALCRQIYYLSMMHTWKLMDRSPQNCALVSIRIRDYNSKDGTHFLHFMRLFLLPGLKWLYRLFWDNFAPIQLNWSCRFLRVFFGILAWVFSIFCLSFEFFHGVLDPIFVVHLVIITYVCFFLIFPLSLFEDFIFILFKIHLFFYVVQFDAHIVSISRKK